MPATVTFVARCDRCPHPDAVWHGTAVNDRGTEYSYIVCPACGEHGSVIPEKEQVA